MKVGKRATRDDARHSADRISANCRIRDGQMTKYRQN
jgi:hypothetical protein